VTRVPLALFALRSAGLFFNNAEFALNFDHG
jgi:hypothetical protein